MKIGLDTNVVIRVLVNDDARQANKAESEIDRIASIGGAVFISNLVVLECIWVLSHRYKVKNDVILNSLFELSLVNGVSFESIDLLHNVNDLSSTNTANLGDLLIGSYNKLLECDTTITFDKKAAKSAVFEKI